MFARVRRWNARDNRCRNGAARGIGGGVVAVADRVFRCRSLRSWLEGTLRLDEGGRDARGSDATIVVRDPVHELDPDVVRGDLAARARGRALPGTIVGTSLSYIVRGDDFDPPGSIASACQ